VDDIEAGGSSLIVIDDFYNDFDRVRREAFVGDFSPRTDSSFSYRTAPVPAWILREAIGKITPILGGAVEKELIGNHFHMSSAMDWKVNLQRGARIHFDEARWAAVIYLNTDEQCAGGTSFYAHVRTGARHFEQLRGRDDIGDVLSDGGCIERWRELISVTMVPNRMILFDAGQFHQAHYYFGTSKQTARLIHNLFFKRVPAHYDPGRTTATT
jgi:hypothetical protein